MEGGARGEREGEKDSGWEGVWGKVYFLSKAKETLTVNLTARQTNLTSRQTALLCSVSQPH